MVTGVRARAGRTATSAFGTGKREAHDASGFYSRFESPQLSGDDRVATPEDLPEGPDACVLGDSRSLRLPGGGLLPDNSVALVVTSPPYFSGKEYEQALGQGHVPGSYLEYLELLRDVFAECKRVLEPGGRIAVNVANLGRKPYRSLSSDVVRILQDDLHLLLRGEVIWRKAEGASGSCAWGSFRSAANPVLRDVTERVVVASKGRFDRAKTVEERRASSLPHETAITVDEFMEATLDVWDIAPESARRVNHPAPFPLQLPQRVIGLYTYREDLVLDPFMGSGTTLVAAIRSGRRYLGFDTDPGYVSTAQQRVKEELSGQVRAPRASPPKAGRRRPARAAMGQISPGVPEDFQARAAREGKAAQAIAEGVLSGAGFRVTQKNSRPRGLGVTVGLIALDGQDVPWYFDVTGAFTTTRGGLLRADVMWRSLVRASVLVKNGRVPVVLLTSHLPRPGSEADLALRALGPGVVFDAVEMLSDAQRERLRSYAEGGHVSRPLPGFWTERELAGL